MSPRRASMLSILLLSLPSARSQVPIPTPPPALHRARDWNTDIPSSYTSSATTSVTPSLTFSSIPTLTACQSTDVQWDLLNDTGIVDFRITLLLLNDGLNQSIPPGLSTTMNQLNPMPTASVNETIMTGDASKTMSYVMNVSVPQGRYYVQGSINDLYGTNAQSNVFSVVETDDISCLNGTPGASSTSPNPNISAGSSKQSGGDSSGESGGGGIPGGAIAGVVIGALVLIAATIFGCMYYRRKKNIRRNRPISGAWIGGTFTRGMRSDMLHESDFQQIREVPRERFGSITALSSGGNTVDESSAEHEDRNRRSRMESPPPDEPAVGFAAYLRRSDGPRSP